MKNLFLLTLLISLLSACQDRSVEPLKLKWVTAVVIVQVVTDTQEAYDYLVTPLGPFEGYCWSGDTVSTGCQGFAVAHFGQNVTGQMGSFYVMAWNQNDTLYSDYFDFTDRATVLVRIEKYIRGN